MISLQNIKDFTSQKSLLIAGVSRNDKKFGNAAYKELQKKGYTVYAMNPNMEKFGEGTCYKSVEEAPQDVTGIFIATNSSNTLQVIKDGEKKGIKHFWVQQGAENPDVMEYANQSESNIITKKCILMFAEPVSSVHKFHRGLVKFFGKYPK